MYSLGDGVWLPSYLDVPIVVNPAQPHLANALT